MEVRPKTISQLLSMYLCRKQLAQATIAETKNDFKVFIEKAGDIEPRQVNEGCVEDFQSDLQKAGLAPTTVNKYLRTLRPVFRWGQRRGWCSDAFAEIRRLKEPKKEVVVYKKDELQRILAVCNKVWRLRFLLAVTAGMRLSEVLNLTIADIDFEKQCIYIRPKQRTATTWSWQLKDKDVRTVPLEEQTERCLAETIAELPLMLPYVCVPEQRYRYLIAKTDQLSEKTKNCPINNYTRDRTVILRKAGVGYKTFHDLRRTCATHWLDNDMPIHAVQKMMGHSNINTTLKYYIKTDDRFIRDAKKVSTSLVTKIARC